MLYDPSLIVTIYVVSIILISIVIPPAFIPSFFVSSILVGLTFTLIKNEQNDDQKVKNNFTTLKNKINDIKQSGYVKNNEDIPLRLVKNYRYIFLEEELVFTLTKLLRYENKYKDAVYSIVNYSEAFMRQVYRMMQKKVNDEKQLRTLGENIINQSYSLLYESSKYEKDRIKQIQQQLTRFVWKMYETATNKIGMWDAAHMPSPHDKMHTNNYDLYVI